MAADNPESGAPSENTLTALVHLETFAEILYAMSDPAFAYDRSGTLVYTNRAYDELMGLSDANPAVGKKIYDLEPDKRELNKEMIEANLARRPDDPLLIIESPSIDPYGTTHWYEWRNFHKFDDEGNVVLVAGLSRDITRRRVAELENERITARLEESNRDLLEFAQVASHDLREPLRKVAAFSERIERKLGDDLDDRVGDYMTRMNGAVARMQGLIDDLLTFSRVNTRVEEMAPTDLTSIVAATLSDLEIAIAEAHAVVEVGELPTLEVDASQLGQLFQNLIANALKFRRPGEAPRVTVTATSTSGEAPSAGSDAVEAYEITVSDNGIGFDQQYASKIFAPFQRLHGRSEYEGTGVGLSVCRRIVERHNGEIWADGGEGTGASFTIRLPVTQAHEIKPRVTEESDLSGLGAEHTVIDTLAA